MTFYRLRSQIWVEGRDYDEIVTQEDIFFEDMEQAMAYILYVSETKSIHSFEITKCMTAIFKNQYTLNKDIKEINHD